jgi:short-chain fatty acids transporter
MTWLASGLINLFVPSGGGQWAVQGGILIASVEQVGAHLEPTVMGLCYGDEHTNMLQPFWALPLLGITGLRARQIIGYTAAAMLLSAPVYAVFLLLLH